MQSASLPKAPPHGPTPGEAEGIQPGPATPPGSGLDREMPIEVMRDFDTVLLFGRLAQAGPLHLKIERMSDGTCFPILDEGSAVLVRGYDMQMAPVILLATVVESSGLGCTMESLGRIDYHTKRKLVRYPLCPPGTIQVSEGTDPEQFLLCQLLNISTGGACIVSDQLYAAGQSLHVYIGAEEDGAVYPCQVVRATPRWGGLFEYGLQFVHLDGEQQKHLAQEIQAIQEETRKELLFDQKHTGWPGRSCPERK